MTNPLTLTKIARKAARDFDLNGCGGYVFSYTNKFPKCRTLKMYRPDDDVVATNALITAIDDALLAAGSTDHSIKIHNYGKNTTYGYVSESIIIRIPN
jgi:hypothetical protein